MLKEHFWASRFKKMPKSKLASSCPEVWWLCGEGLMRIGFLTTATLAQVVICSLGVINHFSKMSGDHMTLKRFWVYDCENLDKKALNVSYIGERINEAVYICWFSRCFYFILADLTGVVTISNIISDAEAKQNGLLWHDTNMGAQPLNVQSADIVTVDSLRNKRKEL